MLDFLELEETVGRAWHRLVGGTASYPVHAEHAVSLAEVRSRIAVMFRALGGETGVQIASASARRSGSPAWLAAAHRARRRAPRAAGARCRDHLPARQHRDLCRSRAQRVAVPLARRVVRIRAGRRDRGGRSAAARSPDAAASQRDRGPRADGMSRPRRRLRTAGRGHGHGAAAPAIAAHRAGHGADRARAARRRYAARGQAVAGDDGDGAAAGQGAARLSFDPAVPALGRLLDTRALARTCG